MLSNYLKIFWRDLAINKWYSLIRILSLTLGLTVFAVIFAYLKFESDFESCHKNAENIYRVLVKVRESYMGKNEMAVTPGALAPAMKEELPEVIGATRVERKNVIVVKGTEPVNERGFLCVDPDFLKMFSYRMVKGDAGKALLQPFTLIITESTAQKYFGEEDPLGKTMVVDKSVYTIEGVMEDPPVNTHLRFGFLTSFLTAVALNGEDANSSWNDWEYYTYVLLVPGSDVNLADEKLTGLLKKYNDDSDQMLFLSSLLKMRRYTGANFEMALHTDPKDIRILTGIALLILLIAGINYINLSTARSLNRAREVGLRKAAGARRSDLIYQFLGESVVISLLSLVLALLIASLVIYQFGNYLGQPLDSRFVTDAGFIWRMFLIATFFGILAGTYPAVYISSFMPATILKEERRVLKGSLVRNILVVSQFIIATILIFSFICITRQLGYLMGKDPGFKKEMVVGIRFFDKKAGLLTEELSGSNNILDMAVSNQLPTDIGNAGYGIWEGMPSDQKNLIYRITVDRNFLDFYGIPVLNSMPGLTGLPGGTNFLVNQSAVRSIGWDEPIGSAFGFARDNMGKVVGVIRDFNFTSYHRSIDPLVVTILPNNDELERGWISVRISPDNIDETLQYIKNRWERIFPDMVFSYSFLDEKIREKYQAELKLRTSLLIFTPIAILIACLGLFVLAAYAAGRRRKETGIRKVVGGETHEILILYLSDFLRLVTGAVAIALPVGYILVNQWLKGFAYHIEIGWAPYGITAGFTLIIGLLTVVYTTLKSCRVNPAEIIKYE